LARGCGSSGAREWTQEELAGRVGCSGALIRKIEAGDRRQQVVITPDPAAIFRRTGTLAFDTDRVADTRFRRQDLLYQNLMLPAIAEIVLVDEPGLLP
jgi:transcriptional regulator with XRE-family HTH domain